eukprot:1159360-Pelagomonas_calceolata.AAC.3
MATEAAWEKARPGRVQRGMFLGSENLGIGGSCPCEAWMEKGAAASRRVRNSTHSFHAQKALARNKKSKSRLC